MRALRALTGLVFFGCSNKSTVNGKLISKSHRDTRPLPMVHAYSEPESEASDVD
jgi:malic enzyme